MLTIDEHVARAPAETCFQVAADVERWPDILPHYRWVRFRQKDGFGNGIVEMAAFRHFGPVPYPTWWLSDMTCDPEAHSVTYRHVGGITRGMDVRWEVTRVDDASSHLRIVHEWSGPSWPLIGGVAANAVIGPHFISHIAGRTLAGVAAESEARARAADSPSSSERRTP